jgi:hypothetical protein
MIILKDVEKIKNKKIDEIAIGDILKRKIDNCYYKIKDICSYNYSEQPYLRYYFYGFCIKYKQNLKYHFVNDLNEFEIYREI